MHLFPHLFTLFVNLFSLQTAHNTPRAKADSSETKVDRQIYVMYVIVPFEVGNNRCYSLLLLVNAMYSKIMMMHADCEQMKKCVLANLPVNGAQ